MPSFPLLGHEERPKTIFLSKKMCRIKRAEPGNQMVAISEKCPKKANSKFAFFR